MKKSFFFRRVLALLLVAILLWAALTALLYSFISRPVFRQIKTDEQQPQATLIAELVARNFLSTDHDLELLLNSSVEIFNAWIMVVDRMSGQTRYSSLPADESSSTAAIQDLIEKNTETLIDGKYASISFTAPLELSTGSTEVLFTGVPVSLQFNEQSQMTIGAVFFITKMDEMNAGLNSMNIALLFASLLVLLLMIVPAYLATAKLIRPLRQTRDVALAMAEGNFGVRADSNQHGEIGELASTMNNLADKLAGSIAELTLERNRLRMILEGMNDGLLAVGYDGLITQTNPAFCRLLGIDCLPAQHSSLEQFTGHTDLAGAYQTALNENKDVALILQRNNRIIQGQIVPLCENDERPIGAVGLFRDITEAERLEQTRRDYVANVSHELRTPLTAMRALVEPLNDGMVSSEDDRRRYYGIILREIIRLSRLINDMLELSRLQAGMLSMPQINFELDQLISDLVDRMAAPIEDAGLTIELPVNLADCPQVIGNPDRVEQVLLILIDNAVKFTPAGGKIRLGVEWNDRQILVSVADNGIGIAPEDIDNVFDRFYKADKAHQQPGTGLGLAIAQEILQRMGQTIRVSSTPGQGTVFTFTLNKSI